MPRARQSTSLILELDFLTEAWLRAVRSEIPPGGRVINTVSEGAVDADRAIGSLLGLAVGDALGTTLEFSARDTRPAVTDLVGGGPFGLRAGEWTDDTSMALCLAESLIGQGGRLDPTDLMRRFTRWCWEGENSVTGRCFDIGTITRSALERFERTGETAASLSPDPHQAGNGTLMRLAPVAIVAAPDITRAVALAEAQSRTTHRATLAHEAYGLFAMLLVEAMTGRSKNDVLRPRPAEGALAAVAAGSWRAKSRNEIASSGYVLDTLEASLWCVGQTDSFAGAVCLAANLGDDADTVAAVTGQLAGALYGRSAIPREWLAKLAWRERIEAIGQRLLSIAHGGAHLSNEFFYLDEHGQRQDADLYQDLLENDEADSARVGKKLLDEGKIDAVAAHVLFGLKQGRKG